MRIVNTEAEDINAIFELYNAATAHQKAMSKTNWNGFEPEAVLKEMAEQRHFKILEDDVIACTFVITLSDPLIWKEASADPAIYIHRIATNPIFRGAGYVKYIVDWAKNYAKINDKFFIRMDTKSGNDKLNNYYVSCGFKYLGVTNIEWDKNLPVHYKEGGLSLFEINLSVN